MSEPQKIKGIVVRTAALGDNGKMLTVLSKERGVISVAAKGVKSLKNPSAAAANPLCLSDMVVKPRGDIYTLASADVSESFYPLRESVETLSYGIYFANLAAMCVGAENPAPEELSLLLNTLYILSRHPDRARVIRVVFEMRLCETEGIAPSIGQCVCGGEGDYFDISEGECVCALHKTESSVKISRRASSVMSYILESDLKTALSFDTPKEVSGEIADIMERFMRFQLGRMPKSLEYLKSIERNSEI